MPKESKDKKKELGEMEEIEYEEDKEKRVDLEKKFKRLKGKLKTCQKEKEQYLSGWQRERADFINYKKEEEKRFKETANFQKGKIILEFLTILDSFEKAEKELQKNYRDSVEKSEDIIQWTNGVLEIKNQIKQILERENIKEINTKGRLNPDLHEVIETVAGEENQITEVVQKGYLFEGKLLRPAMVKVGKKVEKINKSNK